MHVQLGQALEIASPGLNWLGPYDHFCKLGGIEIITSHGIGERRRLKPKIDSTFICNPACRPRGLRWANSSAVDYGNTNQGRRIV
jgi:hypothetical protein